MRVGLFFLWLLPGLAMAVSLADIQQAVNELGAPSYATRQAGIGHLLELADGDHQAVLRECVLVYKQTADPEVKIRLRTALQQIVDKYLYRAPRGFLGIRIGNNNIIVNGGGRIVINGGGQIIINGQGQAANNVTLTAGSIWVGGVIDNTAAQKAGLQANDVIVAVDGKTDFKIQEFTHYIASKQPGDHVKLNVVRGEATNAMDVALGDLPEEQRQVILTTEGGQEYFQKWLKEQMATKPAVPDEPAKK